jgi:AhpD family alkylhydroperoxidase
MSVLDQKTIELISIGAAYAVNCKPCMEFHKKSAEAAGATPEEMLAAIAAGEKVKSGAAVKAKGFARDIFGEGAGEPCCAPGSCSS